MKELLFTLLKIDVVVALLFILMFILMIARCINAYKNKFPERDIKKLNSLNKSLFTLRVILMSLIPLANLGCLVYMFIIGVFKDDDTILKILKVDELVKEDNK